MTHTKNIPQAVFDAAWDGFAGTDWRDKIMAGEDVIVRISGYCVNTKYLTDEQRRELTGRVFHEVLSL